MWVTCTTCGAVVADVDLHTTWHLAHGEAAPTVPAGVDLDPAPDTPPNDGTPAADSPEAP